MSTADTGRLPSWRPGPTRDAVLAFLDAAPSVPVEQRVACFDNDGTLWCERPRYPQLDFFVDALTTAVRADPGLADAPELAAVLGGDRAAIGEIGLERIALALTGLFRGVTPEDFTARVREFAARAVHPTLSRPLRDTTYLPMLELIAALRRIDFTVFVVTGGGTEFVRALSQQLYGVPPEAVVGSLIDYDFAPTTAGSGPRLTRADRLVGTANEGAAKVTHIQTQLGRRPILAAGNSGGDREMLEWAASAGGPTLALLVDHDDATREFSYVSTAETVAEPEPITDVGARLGWTVVSMADDWDAVFPPTTR
ncbi:HAD family hydrolase [Nocardioides sp. Soil805]|uniref:HAD family hydrolase n=1 Tax=Nocardioides sp. Soil805 TaxID=1736416 RepID=UPI00070265D9|nr:HAD family hydrolase [Nocardioides sp. Soil805]KRF37725.1 acid phosphatase [Nocardioides sp. Soil805]